MRKHAYKRTGEKQAAGPGADCLVRRDVFLHGPSATKGAVLTVSPIQAFANTDDR
jgi:hypothetical protein